jgi:predicted transposase/invertase (TIGR01784 family)
LGKQHQTKTTPNAGDPHRTLPRLEILDPWHPDHPVQLEHYLTQFLEIGRAYFQETQGLKFLEAVINYILQATEIEPDKLVQSVASISEKGGDIAMTTAEKLRQEGMQKGIQKGSHKTMVSLVRNAKKNGLSEEMIAQIANLDITLAFGAGPTPTQREEKKICRK